VNNPVEITNINHLDSLCEVVFACRPSVVKTQGVGEVFQMYGSIYLLGGKWLNSMNIGYLFRETSHV